MNDFENKFKKNLQDSTIETDAFWLDIKLNNIIEEGRTKKMYSFKFKLAIILITFLLVSSGVYAISQILDSNYEKIKKNNKVQPINKEITSIDNKMKLNIDEISVSSSDVYVKYTLKSNSLSKLKQPIDEKLRVNNLKLSDDKTTFSLRAMGSESVESIVKKGDKVEMVVHYSQDMNSKELIKLMAVKNNIKLTVDSVSIRESNKSKKNEANSDGEVYIAQETLFSFKDSILIKIDNTKHSNKTKTYINKKEKVIAVKNAQRFIVDVESEIVDRKILQRDDVEFFIRDNENNIHTVDTMAQSALDNINEPLSLRISFGYNDSKEKDEYELLLVEGNSENFKKSDIIKSIKLKRK